MMVMMMVMMMGILTMMVMVMMTSMMLVLSIARNSQSVKENQEAPLTAAFASTSGCPLLT